MSARTPLLLLVVLGFLCPAMASRKPVDPERVLEELLDALRTGTPASMNTFLEERFGGDDSMDTMELMTEVLGKGFRFHGILERSSDRILGLVSDAAETKWTGVLLKFESETGELNGIGLRHADPPSKSAVAPASRDEVVRETARWLRRGYILPELGPRMADRIVGLLEAGTYDNLTSPDSLAIRLTDDLRGIYQDKHLTVLSPTALLKRQKRLSGHADVDTDDEAANQNHWHRWYEHGGIADLWWKEADSSAAVLQFTALSEGPETFETLRRALREMSDRDALIFDLRGVPGWDASVVQELVSHFVSRRERTARLETVDPRTGKRTVSNTWVESGVLSAKLRGKPVYVLVDGGTASAAEALAGLMQRLGGATLIGARTAGAGHMTTTVPLSAGFGLQLPTGRGLDDGSFEGKGLTPDISVPPEEALQVALELLGLA